MNEFVFENQGTTTYLVYTVAEDDVIDSMSLGMMTNNNIPGLANTLFTQRDATKFIRYNVSSKVSVSQFFNGAVNRKRLLGVFKGIVNAFISAEEYMIDESAIILDPNYIFTNVSTCETILICLPIFGKTSGYNISAFFKSVMFTTNFDQTENCDYVAQIINYLNSASMFSLADFRDLLDQIQMVQPMQQPVQVMQPTSPPMRTSIQSVQPQQSVQVIHPSASSMQPTLPPMQASVQSVQPKQPVRVAPPTQASIQSMPSKQPIQAAKPLENTREKRMSMFTLLMHYSKENVEIYKNQKAGKASVPKAKAHKAAIRTGFAIPGQGDSDGFAIPGQGGTNTGFSGTSYTNSRDDFDMSEQKAIDNVYRIPSPKQENQQLAPAQPVSVTQQRFQQNQQSTDQTSGEGMIGEKLDFGNTTVLSKGRIGETSVLNVNTMKQNKQPHLIRVKNNEKIIIDKALYKIGKERSYVDYFIGDNTAISRSHANIVMHDDRFFVVDTNSTNHTFVNGMMIESNVEVEITHGTKLRLANEIFEFNMY